MVLLIHAFKRCPTTPVRTVARTADEILQKHRYTIVT